MQKAVGVVADNFNTMRTGRANPAILDRIQVGTHATCSSSMSNRGSTSRRSPAVAGHLRQLFGLAARTAKGGSICSLAPTPFCLC
jgi:hypothetical protein